MLEQALTHARANRERHLARLCDWLRIPSVSTLPEHRDDVRRAAEYVLEWVRAMGFTQAEIRETGGHPLLYAEWLGTQAPTLLVYGHFDVQPVDPMEEWRHPPFDPVVVGDDLYARGASDDKGQAYAILAALEAYLETSSKLPVNLKILLEGEEEVTSPNLFPYIKEHRDELAADAILIADTAMLDPKLPVVMWGLRGNLYTEIEVRGPARDLHSGTFGGAVDNPFNVLVRLLAGLQDGKTRRVLIPGFYEHVQVLNDEERALIAAAPITDEVGLQLTGAPALGGEREYPIAERVSVRPTLEVHGIAGGFTGEGSKTVIPAKATAKVSTRLVPDQTPDDIATKLEAHLREHCPPTVEWELRILGRSMPVKVDYNASAVQAATNAFERTFGHAPVFLRGGGSLPIVHTLVEELSPPGGADIPVVMAGFGLPDDRTHAPNEKFHLPNFYNGIEMVLHYLVLFAGIQD
jgi:acetylornithine deacetylase/succinyl-diaminopimelate desuccinylase-like protein